MIGNWQHTICLADAVAVVDAVSYFYLCRRCACHCLVDVVNKVSCVQRSRNTHKLMYFVHSLHQQILFSINNIIFSLLYGYIRQLAWPTHVDVVDAVISQTRNTVFTGETVNQFENWLDRFWSNQDLIITRKQNCNWSCSLLFLHCKYL